VARAGLKDIAMKKLLVGALIAQVHFSRLRQGRRSVPEVPRWARCRAPSCRDRSARWRGRASDTSRGRRSRAPGECSDPHRDPAQGAQHNLAPLTAATGGHRDKLIAAGQDFAGSHQESRAATGSGI
jgi:hypothetical protein